MILCLNLKLKFALNQNVNQKSMINEAEIGKSKGSNVGNYSESVVSEEEDVSSNMSPTKDTTNCSKSGNGTVEDRNYNDPSSTQEVINRNEILSESEDKNNKASGENTEEGFPVVLAVFYTTVMPMCGIPAKQNMRSGVSLATVISSMLNSLWTMICLFFELSGCTETGVCCLKNKKVLNRNGEDIEGKEFDHCHRQDTTKKSSKPCMNKALSTGGRIIVYAVTYLIFSTTFTLGLFTIGHALGFMSLKFMEVGPFYVRSAVISGYFGTGLDSKPDQAMFIYLHYKLPDWHYITLNDSRRTKSASFKYVINRLYIGQFQELSHLKDASLTKAIPCTRAMNFLEKHVFFGENFFGVC